MSSGPTHPLAEYPLEGVSGIPDCQYPIHHRSFLAAVMLEASLQMTAPYVKGNVLDVGCGMRPYEKSYFGGADRYTGTDYLSDRSRPDVVCSAVELPFATEEFDTVVSTEVLEHVPDPLRALREMHRVTRKSGHLILSTPFHWPRHEAPYDYFRYPYDGLLHLMASSNWEIVRLFNRGRSYAFLGQVIQHIHPIPWRWFDLLINGLFLYLDRRLRSDVLTMGWTVVARPKPDGEAAERNAG
jgi:SAM-dependent methyltransferase